MKPTVSFLPSGNKNRTNVLILIIYPNIAGTVLPTEHKAAFERHVRLDEVLRQRGRRQQFGDEDENLPGEGRTVLFFIGRPKD